MKTIKQSILGLLPLGLLLIATITKSQSLSQTAVFKDWTPLKETETMVDFSYKVTQCEMGSASLLLLVFNEGASDQELQFTVKITDLASSKSTEKSVRFSAKKATLYRPECDSPADLASLKIAIPNDYDPKNLNVEIH